MTIDTPIKKIEGVINDEREGDYFPFRAICD
jgi:hypothetical protein